MSGFESESRNEATGVPAGMPESPLASERPRPSETPTAPLAGALRWLAAALGATVTVFGVQFVSGAVGAFVLVAAMLAAVPSIDPDALTQQITVPVQVISEVCMLAVFLPWWLYLRPVSFIRGRRRAPRRDATRRALRVVALVLLGIGIQMVTSYALSYLLPLAPDLQTEYTELMDNPVMNEFALLPVLALAVGAPITEELACRGVIFEFALRAACPAAAPRWRDRSWRKVHGEALPALPPVPARAFWVANITQAVLFGILHLNIVQGSYAALVGLVCGWLAWRSGSLIPSMLLHLVVNFSSYFTYEISCVLGAAGVVVAVAASVLLVVAGIWLYNRSAPDGARAVSP